MKYLIDEVRSIRVSNKMIELKKEGSKRSIGKWIFLNRYKCN